MTPRTLLRIEGVAVLAAATAAYYALGGPLWLYAVLFFAPDLGMVGYLATPRVGSWTYNAAHTYALPAVLFGVGVWGAVPWAAPVAAVRAAHIGFDRGLAYGLKFPTGFGDTHLDRDRFESSETPSRDATPTDDTPHPTR